MLCITAAYGRHLPYFLWGYGPVRHSPGGHVEPSPKGRGTCRRGSWATRAGEFCLGHWPPQGHGLNHLLVLVASSKHQVVGQRGTGHRECVTLTIWSLTPNTPALARAALTSAPPKPCHILAEVPRAGPHHLATWHSNSLPLRSVYQRTCPSTITFNSLLWSMANKTGGTQRVTAHLENSS